MCEKWINEYVVVDLETTGLDIQRDEIIEIAAVKVKRGLVVDTFQTLVRCDKAIPAEVSSLTGITEAMLSEQPDIWDVLPGFSDFVGETNLVAHNAAFDRAFLHKYWPDERQWLDTLILSQIVFPCLPTYSLANLTASLNIPNAPAHRALSLSLIHISMCIRDRARGYRVRCYSVDPPLCRAGCW